MSKAVFAGCARSCAPFLDAVLANVEALGSTYDGFEVVIVENDSADDTGRRLREFAQSRDNVRLIEADGLERAHPKRTDRIAAARNLYLEVLRDARYADCDDLVVIDFDDVNCRPVDPAAFAAARRWLWQEPNRRAVFANSSLFYYDIWALRHPSWCPGDCWAEVRAVQDSIGTEEAVRRHVAARQVPISPKAAPIPVQSAFGGLGIYRREAAVQGTYVGLDATGEEVCEHVTFNAEVNGADGVMAIYPALQNLAPMEHILTSLGRTKVLDLEQDGRRCRLIGPPDHPLHRFRANHPLYERRFPALARLVSAETPDGTLIDVGAGIGTSIALARLAGANLPATAVEPSLTDCKYLWANRQRSQALFGKMRIVWGSVARTAGETPPGVQLSAIAANLDVSLVKTDTDGFDQEIVAAELAFLRTKAPILWLEAHTLSAENEAKWRALLDSMAGQWTNTILFDNFGFAIAAGNTADLAGHAVDLMAYARRQRERPDLTPTLYYLDVALFPARFAGVYEEFRRSIPELEG